jgi:uncharacterized Zn-binding protein involved in type VI secretion
MAGLGAGKIGSVVDGYCSCSDHKEQTGIVVSGSGNVITNGLGTATVGSVVVANCGHSSIIVSGATTVFANGLGAGKIGSVVAGDCYTGIVISGSANVFVGA